VFTHERTLYVACQKTHSLYKAIHNAHTRGRWIAWVDLLTGYKWL